jgi:2'-5' RNA ligase
MMIMGIRCFIALDCNENQILSNITDIQRTILATNAEVKCVEPENIHITLKFLGDISNTQVEEVKKIIMETSFNPFKIEFQGIGVFPKINRPRTIWVGIHQGMQELTEIFKKLEKQLTQIGFQPEKRRFNPHLTVCRVKSGRNRKQLIDTLLELRDIQVGELHADNITLKKSVLTPRGPIYTTLANSKLQQ